MDAIRPIATHLTTHSPASADPVREAAEDFEAVFIKQMLQYAGLAEAFGIEESSPVASFSDFVLDRISADLVEQGGFGLADQFYEHLSEKADDADSAPVRL